ncbi:hypothetical protein Q669_28985 [Labrenzia sp. C1B10]|uniref:hypothetical protein n=1 Tax=unclassified Labrenzia TaxID=2648686 RepID=UPI0003B8542C|nr:MULTISPECIES: hypothetical protein [unclassified Labrenzia]ERP96409.1 hypothetical protein Q669_28985 [Labrenzia sp. C1B10]ERS06925.1 hypothetical protein Q675_24845 [Labrenzia sp. C1B70]
MNASLVCDPVFSVFMLYAESGRREFFCIEPMSHLPNGFHLPSLGGLVELEPGATLEGRMSIRLERIN